MLEARADLAGRHAPMGRSRSPLDPECGDRALPLQGSQLAPRTEAAWLTVRNDQNTAHAFRPIKHIKKAKSWLLLGQDIQSLLVTK